MTDTSDTGGFDLEAKFAELRSEVEARWVQAQTRVDELMSSVQDSLRQSIHDLNVKVDDLQARWEEHAAEQPEETTDG